MKAIFEPVYNTAGVEQLNKELAKDGGRTVMVSGCIDTQKLHFSSAIASNYNFQLVITSDEGKARDMAEDARFFNGGNVMYYPAKDVIFYNADVQGRQIAGERIRCIAAIIDRLNKSDIVKSGTEKSTEEASDGPLTIVTTIDGISDMLLPVDRFKRAVINLKKGDILDVEDMAKKLTAMGFERFGMVEAKGQFAIRGGIIDIFSYTDEAPVRIELWDDEIDSIRAFDADSQRSIENYKSYTVFPATEFLFTEDEIEHGIEKIRHEKDEQMKLFGADKRKRTKEQIEAGNHLNRMFDDALRTGDYSKFIYTFADRVSSLAEYFPKGDTLIVVDEPVRLKEHSDMTFYEYSESMKNRLESGYVLPSQTHMFMDMETAVLSMNGHKQLVLTTLEYTPEFFGIDYSMHIEARSISSYNNSFEYLSDDIRKYKRSKYAVLLVCSSRTRANRIVDDLGRLGIESFYTEDSNKSMAGGLVMVTYGSLHRGFEYPLQGFVCIAENDIYTEKKRKRIKKKEYDGKNIAGFNELNIGDYVVHENYGIGQYKGIEKIKVEGVEKDYIKISYADNSNLYVLATQLDRLQKFAGSDVEKKPKLNKIGGSEWGKTKSKVHSAVEEVAKDLVELYATRQRIEGYQFGPDTVWQREFEEMFPYEETEDQLAAIEDTKKDMESTKIMDRLVCGDVGYGKTEIALRAAFKAVQESRQVVYLVPTTILAQQVYNTFVQRMNEFPVRVDLLCRFRTPSQQQKTIADLKKGQIDIIIGTHRVLSKDVTFKNLGLLIIDEEQRFGVAHKEKIKQLQKNVDVLTLTATPIPRTMHMSLIGIRDMSVLEEAPQDRQPIQTFVCEYNEEMVREAINRELARGGQVYYVYNRVQSIADMANTIQKLVPDANVGFAHGQMKERELEKIMYGFINGEIDVLVSTTIIETGLDISNVNTMIIHDSDQMGLSQLYQLRGRVGRSNRTSYAFLMYRRNKMLKEVAEKRLHAIREFTEMGSGFKIAMRDLEIRGTGNLLGAEQSGHMESVGYDLYCKMLAEAVQEAKGIAPAEAFETTIDLNVSAYIPDSYISNESLKLDTYKRIAAIENKEEYEDMTEELTDRFGEPPKNVQNLLAVAELKALAHCAYVTELKQRGDSVRVTLQQHAKIDVARIPELLQKYRDELKFQMESLAFVYTPRRRNSKEKIDLLEKSHALVEDLLQITQE